MTKAFEHEFQENQYSIKIGNEVPKDDVNIAYFDTPPLSSKENISLTDMSSNISSNYWGDRRTEAIMFPDSKHLLHSTEFSSHVLPTDDFLITDEFNYDGNNEIPLYYQYKTIYTHLNSTNNPANNIKVLDNKGNEIDENKYKIELISTEKQHEYNVLLKTNFQSDNNETYFIQYSANKGSGTLINNHNEVINAEPIFKEVSKEEVINPDNINKNIYTTEIDTSTNGYQIFVPIPAASSKNELRNVHIEGDFGVPFAYQAILEGFAKGEQNGLAITFVIDDSASMNGTNPWDAAKQMAAHLRDNSDINHKFNLRHSEGFVFNNFVDANTFIDGVPNRTLSGNTNIVDITFAAIEWMKNINLDGWKKSVVVISDGQDNSSSHNPISVNRHAHNVMDIEIYGVKVTGNGTSEDRDMISITHGAGVDYNPELTDGPEDGGDAEDRGYYYYIDCRNNNENTWVSTWSNEHANTLKVKIEGHDYFWPNQHSYGRLYIQRQGGNWNYKKHISIEDDNNVIFTVSGLDPGTYRMKVEGYDYGTMLIKEWYEYGNRPYNSTQVMQDLVDTNCLYIGNDILNRLVMIGEKTKPVPIVVQQLSGTSIIYKRDEEITLKRLIPNIPDTMADNWEITLMDTSENVDVYFYDNKSKKNIGTHLTKSEVNNAGHIYVNAQTDYLFSVWTRKYSIKLEETKGIYTSMPESRDLFKNWYLTVHNGRFNIETGDVVNYYYLPEFEKQLRLNNGTAIFRINNETPQVIDEKIVKLHNTPLYIESELVNNEFTINNLELREDNRKIKIKSYNAQSGILYLDDRIDQRRDIKVDYQYQNENYIYRGYYDPSKNRFVHLDLNPFEGHTYTKRLGNGSYIETTTKDLFNQPIYLYIRPAGQMTSNYDIIPGSRKQISLFHTVGTPIEDLPTHPLYSPHAQLLSKIYLQQNSNEDDITVIDTRQRGGGLKETISREIIDKINPEANYYWDIGYRDGKAYPGNSTIVVKLPKEILKEYGGKFEESEIEEIIDRHVAYGTYFIIEYVDQEDYLEEYNIP